MTTLAEIEQKALELDSFEREHLASSLIDSLDPISELELAWAKLAKSRHEAYKAGTRRGVPAKEFFEKFGRKPDWLES